MYLQSCMDKFWKLVVEHYLCFQGTADAYLFTPKCIDSCPKIFHQQSQQYCFGPAKKIWKAFRGPKYDGKYLHKIIKQKLGDLKLHQTLTDVIVPTFDITSFKPMVFSTYKLKRHPSIDAYLSDICIGTSAAPTYLPSHYFQTEKSAGGGFRRFNLIDGSVMANDPALVAIDEFKRDARSSGISLHELMHCRTIVVSLGTGISNEAGKYSAPESAKWGVPQWLTSGGSTPILNSFIQSNLHMVKFHFSVELSDEDYLRIQDENLSGDLSLVDGATEENLERLVEAGEKLLKKPVCRVNMETGEFESLNDVSNEEALKKLAQTLVHLKRLHSPTVNDSGIFIS